MEYILNEFVDWEAGMSVDEPTIVLIKHVFYGEKLPIKVSNEFVNAVRTHSEDFQEFYIDRGLVPKETSENHLGVHHSNIFYKTD
jgi:hypothetical protein